MALVWDLLAAASSACVAALPFSGDTTKTIRDDDDQLWGAHTPGLDMVDGPSGAVGGIRETSVLASVFMQ